MKNKYIVNRSFSFISNDCCIVIYINIFKGIHKVSLFDSYTIYLF